MNILFFTKYSRSGASSRYRSFQYFNRFIERGETVYHQALFSEEYLANSKRNRSVLWHLLICYLKRIGFILKAPTVDIVIVEKELFPYIPFLFELVFWKMLKSRVKVLDYDDAIWHNYDKDRIRVSALYHSLKCKIPKLIRYVDLVVCGSEYILNYVNSSSNTHSIYLPTSLPKSDYQGQGLYSDKTFDIVWIGSQSTSKYVETISSVLIELVENFDIKICIIGASIEFNKRYSSKFHIVDWYEGCEFDYLPASKVGIMPLIDSPFELGKCAFKAIQYMGVGIPSVVSPIGQNVRVIQNGITGLHARDLERWKSALLELIFDDSKRDFVGRNAYAHFKEYYSTESSFEKFYCTLISKNL